MMKNKPLLPIAILLIVGATLFANPFTQNNYVGTWNNTIVYKDVTIDSVLIIKNNKDISYVRTYSDGSGTYTREGTWKKEDDHIKIIFNKDNESEEYPLYLLDNKSLCVAEKNCKKDQVFHKKSLFSKKIEYIYDEEDTMIDQDDIIENDNHEQDVTLPLKKDGKVIIYFFRGEGCSHCAEAEAWFESIEEEYGDYFTIKDYETWYNQDNAEYMQKVAESRGDEAGGVPYIIIGDYTWLGFTEEYEDEMIQAIVYYANYKENTNQS